MAKPYPKEFGDDVVAVACNGEAPLAQIAKDFGISQGCLQGWLQKAEVEDGTRPGLTGRIVPSFVRRGSGCGCWSRRNSLPARP